MSLRRIPGRNQEYFLISYDKKGHEVPDADGSSASQAMLDALTAPGSAVTDVFVLSHGWQGDYDDAISQYDRWVGAADPDTADDGIRPFVVGLHWPSKAWSDRELRSAPSGLLGDGPEPAADGMTVDEAVDEYAATLGDDADTRAALAAVLTYASTVDPARDASAADALPTSVASAYRQLAGAAGAEPGDDPLLGGGWDPAVAFAGALTGPADDGLLGDGIFSKLREAILTPLRQLTFWHGKNQAREFGESGAADLVREIMRATPATTRVHLMGHSFGTIVVSGAVRGPGARPAPPPRPVSSMLLVQGAVSLWAFAESAPAVFGGGSGYFADVVTPAFVSGPIVVTRSKWDYAVGKFYPLAVRLAGQYLLGDEPKYGGIGAFGAVGVAGSVELPALAPGARVDGPFTPHTLYNIDASGVIAHLDGAAGAHNDLAHPELSWLAWTMATARPAH